MTQSLERGKIKMNGQLELELGAQTNESNKYKKEQGRIKGSNYFSRLFQHLGKINQEWRCQGLQNLGHKSEQFEENNLWIFLKWTFWGEHVEVNNLRWRFFL